MESLDEELVLRNRRAVINRELQDQTLYGTTAEAAPSLLFSV